MNRTQALKEKPFDAEPWQKSYYRHQQQYIRNRLVIHLLRLRLLHHLPLGTTLSEIEQQLERFWQSHQFLCAEQVQKTLNFILTLVA